MAQQKMVIRLPDGEEAILEPPPFGWLFSQNYGFVVDDFIIRLHPYRNHRRDVEFFRKPEQQPNSGLIVPQLHLKRGLR